MQVALQGAATATSVKEIPVPPPMESDINYDALYSRRFAQPVNYIRFSQTVEECIGCQYDMTEDDDEYLKAYNQKRSAKDRLSEDDFEYIMEVFEDTASVATPFASVDKTVVPYDHMVGGLHELQMPKIMIHAKETYEYWKQRRTDTGSALHPSLKFETHQETDEMDPFVCFRRREVRQTRKTRARDIQSADKLKKLRQELETGRQLVILSHQREITKRDLLSIDRAVFEQRAKLKQMKIRLGIKVDDEDLVHQKVSIAPIPFRFNTYLVTAARLTFPSPKRKKRPNCHWHSALLLAHKYVLQHGQTTGSPIWIWCSSSIPSRRGRMRCAPM